MINFGRYLEKVIGTGYRSSAIVPLLWLNALISAPCFIGSFFISTDFRWALFILAAIIVIYTLFKYNYLMHRDPRLLQSEKFQLEAQKLDIVAKKGGPVTISPVDLITSEGPNKLIQNTDKLESKDV